MICTPNTGGGGRPCANFDRPFRSLQRAQVGACLTVDRGKRKICGLGNSGSTSQTDLLFWVARYPPHPREERLRPQLERETPGMVVGCPSALSHPQLELLSQCQIALTFSSSCFLTGRTVKLTCRFRRFITNFLSVQGRIASRDLRTHPRPCTDVALGKDEATPVSSRPENTPGSKMISHHLRSCTR